MLALPLKLIGPHIIDVNGVPIALLNGEMAEYRERGAEIVAAVNSYNDLLDAAHAVAACIEIGTILQDGAVAMQLNAAIAKAEQG